MSQPTKVNGYDRDAPRPKAGSRWVWEIDKAHARWPGGHSATSGSRILVLRR